MSQNEQSTRPNFGVRNLRRFHFNGIRSALVYTLNETAQVIGCNPRTVIGWIKNHGLNAHTIDGETFIEGSEIKAFSAASRELSKIKLAPGEYFCVRCRKGVCPEFSIPLPLTETDRYPGAETVLLSQVKKARCPNCCSTVCLATSINITKGDSNV